MFIYIYIYRDTKETHHILAFEIDMMLLILINRVGSL